MIKHSNKSKDRLKDPNFDQELIKSIPNSIFVTRIPSHFTQQQLFELFSKFGSLVKCYIVKRKNGKGAGYGYAIAGNNEVF